MSSRNRILQRLHSSLNGQQAAAVADPLSVETHWPVPEPDEWQDLFIRNLTDNHAEVICCTVQNWTATLAARLAGKNITVLRSGPHREGRELVASLKAAGLDAACVTDGINKDNLFTDIEAGFSVAMAGLAETGSLLLQTGEREPRTLSLVPPLNIILLRASSMAASFSALIAAGRLPQPMPTNLLLISGPSKTADIQQTLAYGAHGPRELIVILLTDA